MPQPRIREGFLPQPSRNPIDRHVEAYDELFCAKDDQDRFVEFVAASDRAMHTAVYGMASALRAQFALRVLEDAVQAGDAIFSLTTNGSTQGLGTSVGGGMFGRRETLAFGLDVHGFTIGVEDGPTLAALFLQGFNISCDVRHIMETKGINDFYHAIVSAIVERAKSPTTLHLDVAQAEFSRRRHTMDGDTIKALADGMEIGHDSQIRVIATASSPNEIPIELRNALKTRILVRMNDDNQVGAAQSIIHSALKSEMYREHGMARMMIGQAFISPGDNFYADRLAYLPLVEALSRARPGAPDPASQSERHKKAIKDILSARRRNKGGKGKVTKKKAKASSTATCTNADAIMATGLTDYVDRACIARLALTLRDTGTVSEKGRHPIADVLAAMDAPSVGVGARWAMRARVAGRLKEIAAPAVAGHAFIVAHRDDPEGAEAFFADLVSNDSNPLRRKLLKMDAAARSLERLNTILDHWANRSDRRNAANDDDTIAQAI